MTSLDNLIEPGVVFGRNLQRVYADAKASDIAEAISYGVVKMSIDTDTQWVFWQGVLNFYQHNSDRLHSQLGNRKGPEVPNKKFYDPRVWLRHAEESMMDRLLECFTQLNCVGRFRAGS